MTTKKRQCKLPSVKGPKKGDYNKQTMKARKAFALFRKLFRRTRSTKEEPLPAPHPWPPYGGKCFQSAYDEATALKLVADVRKIYEAIMSASYKSEWAVQYYTTAYENAKAAYRAAWEGMENCLITTV